MASSLPSALPPVEPVMIPPDGRSGESRTANRSSTEGMSSGRRGGQRPHKGSQEPTYDQLYAEAQRRHRNAVMSTAART
jgi:hypothetical protein